ncbi:sulfur carrier protein ThiS [Gilvimarinus sp. F26214L]|uniref:sulfur carrier protein ThiS n=1 Tax=Gilvimarinus sp. DZF01 TaxID=3461371 RepID=UPI0040465227
MLKISLNDEWVDVPEPRLAAAMAHWNYDCNKCAVAVNGEFVPRSNYEAVTLNDGDRVDVVAPVGGG